MMSMLMRPRKPMFTETGALVTKDYVGDIYVYNAENNLVLYSVARSRGDFAGLRDCIQPVRQRNLFEEECKVCVSPDRYCQIMADYTAGNLPGTHSTWSKALDYAKRIGLYAHMDKGYLTDNMRNK